MKIRSTCRQIRRLGAASAIAAFTQFSTASAGEAPGVTVQANAPGWITVNYYHSGLGGVLRYDIQRLDSGVRQTMYSPNGQFTDSNLTPDTEYSYRVCAVFPTEDDPSCSPWFAARTLALPAEPTGMNPPIITNISATPDTVTVSWGATGSYSKILVRIEDDLGNSDQRDVRNIPDRSFSFPGMRTGARYTVSLKGCGNTLLGSSCGPWSPAAFVTTPAPDDAPAPTAPAAPEMTVERTKTSVKYINPTLAGVANASRRLDYCLHWGTDCGRPTANAFCFLMDAAMPIAASFNLLNDVGPTSIISTGEICEAQECDSFSFITCGAPVNNDVKVLDQRGPGIGAMIPADKTGAIIEDRGVGVAAMTRKPAAEAAIVEDRVALPSAALKGASSDKTACASGYVWRAAQAEDLVCVTPAARARVAEENRLAGERRDPTGAYGPNTCRPGFVWREAFSGDVACVTPESRALAKDENRLAPSRRAN